MPTNGINQSVGQSMTPGPMKNMLKSVMNSNMQDHHEEMSEHFDSQGSNSILQDTTHQYVHDRDLINSGKQPRDTLKATMTYKYGQTP